MFARYVEWSTEVECDPKALACLTQPASTNRSFEFVITHRRRNVLVEFVEDDIDSTRNWPVVAAAAAAVVFVAQDLVVYQYAAEWLHVRDECWFLDFHENVFPKHDNGFVVHYARAHWTLVEICMSRAALWHAALERSLLRLVQSSADISLGCYKRRTSDVSPLREAYVQTSILLAQ